MPRRGFSILFAVVLSACAADRSSGAVPPNAVALGARRAATTDGTATSGAVATPDSGGPSATDTDFLPWRPLHVTAAPEQYTHALASEGTRYFKDVAGLDTRAAKLAGKLVVTLGVSQGGYSVALGKRGFHVFGVFSGNCPHINDWTLGRDYDGNCRLNTLDG
ncbi:MAG TPA: hypothetical protein VK745_11265, partial [Polyangiaceae bacterium]|nr:hypothetical protein [Polyangiaceae bacterium]